MTAAVILGTFLASVFLYRSTEWDGYLFGLSFYVLTFLAGMLTASAFASLSRDKRCIYGIGVLWLNFLAMTLVGEDPHLVVTGGIHIATAAWFIRYGVTRWEWTVGGLFLVMVLVALLGAAGGVPDAEERVASGFIVFSVPDLTTLLAEIAMSVLGFAAGDAGKGFRVRLRVPVPWARAAAEGPALRAKSG